MPNTNVTQKGKTANNPAVANVNVDYTLPTTSKLKGTWSMGVNGTPDTGVKLDFATTAGKIEISCAYSEIKFAVHNSTNSNQWRFKDISFVPANAGLTCVLSTDKTTLTLKDHDSVTDDANATTYEYTLLLQYKPANSTIWSDGQIDPQIVNKSQSGH